MLKMVVLPAPLGPIRPAIDPRGTNMSMLSTATRPPKRLVRPLMTRMSSAKAELAVAALMRPALPGYRRGLAVPGRRYLPHLVAARPRAAYLGRARRAARASSAPGRDRKRRTDLRRHCGWRANRC